MKSPVKIVLLILAVAVFVFALTGVALAMSPQEIADYYAIHGTLPPGISTADLQAFLADAANVQYLTQTQLAGLVALVKDTIADRQEGGDNEFPFTGFEMIAGLGAAVALIGGGFTLRKFARKA